MGCFRRFLIHRRRLATLVLACVLAVRMLVPTGFMPAVADHGIALRLCAGMMPGPSAAVPQGHAMAATHHRPSPGGDPHPVPDVPCGFAGFGLAALGVAFAVVVGLAMAFASLPAAWMPRRRKAAPPSRWRPPLRAPPVFAPTP